MSSASRRRPSNSRWPCQPLYNAQLAARLAPRARINSLALELATNEMSSQPAIDGALAKRSSALKVALRPREVRI